MDRPVFMKEGTCLRRVLPVCAVVLFSICFLLSERVFAMNIVSFGSGLKLVLEKRPGSGVVAAQIWVKVGSKYEDEKVAGITHFIEHLIFKGTEKLKGNAFATRIESLGGSVNAFTSYDDTVYHVIVPRSAFPEGLELLLESVKNPVFPENEIEKERQVILEEIKMGEDDTQRKLFKELFAASYHGHPYGRPVIGFAGTLSHMTRADIVDYYRVHYTPDNIAVVVVGDFDEKAAKKTVERYFGDGEKPTQDRPSLSMQPFKGEDDVVRVIEKDLREDYLALAYRIPEITHKDIPALEVLGTLLAGGESSRLVQSLKRRMGLVTGISTYVFSPKEEGLFVIYATFSGKERDEILRVTDSELEKTLSVSPSQREIEKAKNMIKASYIYAAETVQGKARQIGDFQTLTGDPQFLDAFIHAIDKVSIEDIQKVYRTYLVGKKRAVVHMKSRKQDNPFTKELPNGMKCVINKNKASQSFAFRVGFVGGLKEEPAGRNGAFNVLARLLLKGTHKKDARTIAEEIDFLAGDISPYNGRNLFGVSGKFLSKDIKRVFALLREILIETNLKKEELVKVKEEVLSGIRQRDDDPVGYTFLRFNEMIYKRHPYSRDPSGTERDVQDINIEELKELYQRFVTPSGSVIAISGDVDEKEVFSFFSGLFSGWSGKKNELARVSAAAAPQKAVIEKNIMQTHMIFGFLAPGLIDEDRYAVEVMDSILSGMSGRIHKVLREENPYAYAVTFFNQMAYEVSGMGIYIGTDAKYVSDVERIAKAEIARILEEGFTDEEVVKGKNYLIGNHYIRMQANSGIATSMCFDVLYGLKSNSFKLYPAYIDGITPDNVNRAARKYLLPDVMVQMSVGNVGRGTKDECPAAQDQNDGRRIP